MDSQGIGPTKDLRDWPFLGQLSRSGISQAASRMVVRIHWSWSGDRRTGERTSRLGFCRQCCPPSGELRGCAATRIGCPLFCAWSPSPSQKHLHSAQVGGFLRWCYGPPAEKFQRERGDVAV